MRQPTSVSCAFTSTSSTTTFGTPPSSPADELPPDAMTLLRSLQRDGAPVDLKGQLLVGAIPISIPIERYDRLAEPRAVVEHLDRIRCDRERPSSSYWVGERVCATTACKLILDDYGEKYERRAELMDLYKATAKVLKLSQTPCQTARKAVGRLSGCSKTWRPRCRAWLNCGTSLASVTAAPRRVPRSLVTPAWQRTAPGPSSSFCSIRGMPGSQAA